MPERTLILETLTHTTKQVTIAGWVQRIRNHGKVLFLDIRDRSGLLQVVSGPWQAEAYAILQTVSPESVIELSGTVVARQEKMINPDLPTGTIELQAEQVVILNLSQTPPFSVNENTAPVDEELRLQYRYLDLRTERMHENLVKRAATIRFIRAFLDQRDFTEVETPLLTASTPEGSRDFIVPTRTKGTFFALPQSPQQFKQLLMVSGVERYYQIAKCLRDEDSRGDRQPEFTQLDLEMSFVDREAVMALNEELLIRIVETLYPEKTIQQKPFPRLTYQEAMDTYGTDRPDLRNDPENPNLLAFCWVIDFPFFEKTDTGTWTFTHNPFSRPKEEDMDRFLAKKDIGEILTSQYDVVVNGSEIGGGSIRNYQLDALRTTFEIMGYDAENIQRSFGHMLKAFSFGAPPHGGIAWGLDRLVMILCNEPNIREVIAFPKTGEGRDPLMQAPSPVSEAQLLELGIAVLPPAPNKKA